MMKILYAYTLDINVQPCRYALLVCMNKFEMWLVGNCTFSYSSAEICLQHVLTYLLRSNVHVPASGGFRLGILRGMLNKYTFDPKLMYSNKSEASSTREFRATRKKHYKNYSAILHRSFKSVCYNMSRPSFLQGCYSLKKLITWIPKLWIK